MKRRKRKKVNKKKRGGSRQTGPDTRQTRGRRRQRSEGSDKWTSRGQCEGKKRVLVKLRRKKPD